MSSSLERMRVLAAHLQPVGGPAPPTMGPRAITPEELAQHKSAKSMWIAVDGVVYDMTEFLDDHPGGKRLPLKYGGADASEAWHSMHRPEIMAEHGARLKIGVLVAAGNGGPAPSAGVTSAAPGGGSGRDVRAYTDTLAACAKELRVFIDEENCHPILIRLAWHDSGTYDQAFVASWPACGGANGSIRFAPELAHGANAGLKKAILYLEPFNEKFPTLSWADLIQLASATALELAGGPKSPLRYGRLDVSSSEGCPPEGRLPGAYPPFPGEVDAATHLRQVFGRMGFSDSEIVALSGAHTLGRAFKERSGVVSEGYGKGTGTVHTNAETGRPRLDSAPGLGMAGGKSWTQRWLAFDNSYYTDGQHAGSTASEQKTSTGTLLEMPTDAVLRTDPIFRRSYLRYAHNPRAFFADFASAHAKLAELGSCFDPPEGILMPEH